MVKKPYVIVESIVYEFYAIVPNIVNNNVKAYDTLVSFDSYHINVNYDLVDVGQGEYENCLSNVKLYKRNKNPCF